MYVKIIESDKLNKIEKEINDFVDNNQSIEVKDINVEVVKNGVSKLYFAIIKYTLVCFDYGEDYDEDNYDIASIDNKDTEGYKNMSKSAYSEFIDIRKQYKHTKQKI